MTAALAFTLLAVTSDTFPTSAGPVKITPIQHATLVLEAGGQAIYIDPTSAGRYDGLPQADLILITHTHGDHLDVKLLPKIRKPGTAVIAPPAAQAQLPDAKYLRNGETTDWGKWKIEAVPAYNLQRGPAPGRLFHEKGAGNGYVLTYGDKRFYIAGDTEGTPEMKALRNIDVAFIPMNLPYTMPPAEAADAVKAFKPKVVYPYHYRGSDLKAFESALQGSGVEVRIREWYGNGGR